MTGTRFDAGGPRRGPKPRPAGRATGWMSPSAPPTTTVLLRHGETPLSVDMRFSGRGDVDLTDAGVVESELAARCLRARRDVHAVVSSPLRRARRTAQIVASALGLPLLVEDGFRETDFGDWEGLTFAEARAGWPDELAAWTVDPSMAPPGGESFADVAARVEQARRNLLERFPRKTILVVSHVTPIKTLVRLALDAPPAALHRMHLDSACLAEIDWYDDGAAVVRSLNDTHHLAFP